MHPLNQRSLFILVFWAYVLAFRFRDEGFRLKTRSNASESAHLDVCGESASVIPPVLLNIDDITTNLNLEQSCFTRRTIHRRGNRTMKGHNGCKRKQALSSPLPLKSTRLRTNLVLVFLSAQDAIHHQKHTDFIEP